MSHFTVMVIGENPEEQLAPYSEHIQTAPRDTGVVPEDEIQGFLDYYKDPKNGGLDLPFDQLYELKGNDWNSNRWAKVDGELHDFTTYNEKSKWDWYQLGGRWADFLKMKQGVVGQKGEPSLLMEDFETEPGRADAALKSEIDIEGMKDEDGKKAGEKYDKAIALFGDLPLCEDWDILRKRFTNDDTDYSRMDEAREAYRNQPRVEVMGKSKDFGYSESPEDFNISREQYVENARNRAISTFAVVKDGVWYEKGKMGWWGMTSNEKDQNEWNKQLMELLDSVPDDTLISIYDCHI